MALAGFRRHQTLGAVRKTLILDGGKSVLRHEAGEGASKNEDGLSHIFPRDFDDRNALTLEPIALVSHNPLNVGGRFRPIRHAHYAYACS
jgi:hypothetical protein